MPTGIPFLNISDLFPRNTSKFDPKLTTVHFYRCDLFNKNQKFCSNRFYGDSNILQQTAIVSCQYLSVF